jgi:hypothetical protein
VESAEVVVTPHEAGGMPQGSLAHVAENYSDCATDSRSSTGGPQSAGPVSLALPVVAVVPRLRECFSEVPQADVGVLCGSGQSNATAPDLRRSARYRRRSHIPCR